jgi:predicted DNA-binding protein
MSPSGAPHQRHVQYSARHQARLDAETHAKLEEFARTFSRTRSDILRYVMQWGLTQTGGWTVDMAVPGTVRTLSMLLEPELLQQVREAAAVHGATVAAWVRQAMRQVRVDDFPESWRMGVAGVRSHDSPTYGRRFMLRLDETTVQKLQRLVEHFAKSRAEVIRQLIAQATPEDFPPSWHLAVREHQQERGV